MSRQCYNLLLFLSVIFCRQQCIGFYCGGNDDNDGDNGDNDNNGGSNDDDNDNGNDNDAYLNDDDDDL